MPHNLTELRTQNSELRTQNSNEIVNYSYITFLRVFAAFSVIAIHIICTPVSSFPETYSTFNLRLSYFFVNFFRMIAVPLFVMISGALFLNLNKEITLEKLLKKNFLKLILCLCIFSYLFCLMETFFNNRKISANLFLISLKNAIEGNSWAHLWYMYMLPGIYLFVPLLRSFIRSSSEKEFKFTLAVLFIFLSVIPTAEEFFSIKIGLNIPVSSVWLFYFLLGHAIHSEKIEFSLKTDIILIAISLIYLTVAVFIPGFQKTNDASVKLTGTSSIFSVLYSIGLFSLVKKIHKKDNLKITKTLSSLSLGIYIFHAVTINFAYKVLKLQPQKINIFFMWILVFMASLISSCTVTWLLRKIPFVKKYIL